MRNLKLLEAIGNIDDNLIEKAAPQKCTNKRSINWTRLGSLAACICLFFVGIWVFHLASDSLQKSTSIDMEAAEAPGISDKSDVITEGNGKSNTNSAEEPAAEEAVPEESAEEELFKDTGLQKESILSPEGKTPESGSAALDTAYSFSMNGTDYYLFSPDTQNQQYALPKEVMDLIGQGTYPITEADLGDVMGTVKDSKNQNLIGAAVYHFAKFPDSNTICIVEHQGIYEFYVSVIGISE